MKLAVVMTANFFLRFFLCRIREIHYLCTQYMNWKFILRWVITFTVCLVIYDITGSFWMSLGILILLAVVESLVIDWWNKRKGRSS